MASHKTQKEDSLYADHHDSRQSDSPPPKEHLPVEHDHAFEKKLIRKIDWRLLPILGALYSIALIDRVNV
jgi:hypothetical protein